MVMNIMQTAHQGSGPIDCGRKQAIQMSCLNMWSIYTADTSIMQMNLTLVVLLASKTIAHDRNKVALLSFLGLLLLLNRLQWRSY